MFVYVVIYGVNYEGSNVVGVFSDLDKANEFVVDYEKKNGVGNIKDYDYIMVRKVEVDKIYDDNWEIGEEV